MTQILSSKIVKAFHLRYTFNIKLTLGIHLHINIYKFRQSKICYVN